MTRAINAADCHAHLVAQAILAICSRAYKPMLALLMLVCVILKG